ncbi:MAG: hypothetical protein WBR26_03170 [Candidatus Acidiferrum sp.]
MSSGFSQLTASSKRAKPRGDIFYAAAVPALLAMILLWPFGGGGTKVQMMAGTVTPGAQGTIIVHNGTNNNARLELKVKALANPNALTPAENVYVVWVQPPDQPAQNQGQLKVNKNEEGALSFETSYQRFEVFITAEQNAQVQTPQGPQVLSADVAAT